MKALINAHIFDFEQYKENQFIIFDEEIINTGDMKDFPGADETLDLKGAIVMPGLINCHAHIYSTFARGMNVPFNPRSFKDILEQLWWKLDSKLDLNATYYSGLISGYEFIQNGITTVIDHHASGLNIKGSLNELKKSVCDDMGLRGIFCFETSDRFDIDDCIEENLNFAREKSEKHAGLFGMHASMSLSNETLKKISEAIGDMPVHIHAAESNEDEEDSISKYGKSVVERLNDFGLIKRNSILAHCVHINKNEAEIIGANGAYVAVNPTSNMNNAVGIPDYNLLKSQNIKCILGNDGLGMNITRDCLNLFFAMKNRIKSPTAFSVDDLLSVIDNGYEYIGNTLGIKIGRIQKGYKADMVSLDYNPPTPMDSTNAAGHLFFGILDNFHPRNTWCGGKQLMKDYELPVDTQGIYKNARKEAQRVWNRL